ncbi:chromosome partitioning protein ParA [Comamonas thiooxydans]|uniref:chromosome partitioning protein ParA n=1 Tax=Comamonas thiooxydans TaxID=363952 RepID=UPI00057A8C9B|nr:chromosome partitioning protein ParA [Comamonas thiooxydans]
MNKIIVVGHPQSGFESVEELLLNCGMAEAKPSRREGFVPAQISETLVKVHGAVPVQHVCVADQLAQIEVAPVWQGLALDLMLANVEQPLWGWADAQAVYLLDYWKSQDPQTVFVLVFDEPQSVFTRHALEHADANPQEQEARINGWLAYNSSLLHFHLRNPERSLLVHAAQVKASAQSYLQQLSLHVDAQLRLPIEEAQPLVDRDSQDLGNDLIQVSAGPVSKQKQALDCNPLAQWLAQQLLEEYPQATELYEQLQAAASLPQRSQTQTGRQPVASSVQANRRYQAWSAFVAQQAAMQAHAQRLLQLGKELDEQAQQVQQREWQIEQLNQAGVKAQQRAQEQERLLAVKVTELQSSGQENQLLLKQLHKMQEELERRYQQATQQEQALTELNKIKADLKVEQEKTTALQAVERKKQALLVKAQQSAQEQERLLAIKVTELHSSGEESQLLLKQLHKVQEELERRYQQAIQQEKALTELNKVKADLRAAQEKNTALQAVGREKQTLQEQLQKVQQELANRKAQAQQEEKTQAELPRVKAELKAAQDKTVQLQRSEEQLKRQLQAQGAKASAAIDLEKENELLLTQLHKVQEELERHYLENSKLKATQKPQSQAYYGAADRVKQQLPYRLGATMIRKSRSIGGWLNMPFALRAEAKRYTQDQAANKSLQLPPITQYRDAHEAELIKQHLSYRLGACLVASTKTLGGRISLPWSLYAEVKAFRKERQPS